MSFLVAIFWVLMSISVLVFLLILLKEAFKE